MSKTANVPCPCTGTTARAGADDERCAKCGEVVPTRYRCGCPVEPGDAFPGCSLCDDCPTHCACDEYDP